MAGRRGFGQVLAKVAAAGPATCEPCNVIVIIGIALVACFLFALAMVTNLVIVLVDDNVPSRGPLRGLALARLARREAASIDAEYRELLRS